MRRLSMKGFDVYKKVMGRIRLYILLCPLEILFLLLMVSCGSSKNTSKRSGEQEIKKDITENIDASGDRNIHENSQKDEEVEMAEIITEYSMPDSLGNQYPMKRIEKRTTKKMSQEGKKVVKEAVSSKSNMVDRSEERIVEKEDVKTEKKESRQIPMIVVGCFIIVLVFFVYKRKIGGR